MAATCHFYEGFWGELREQSRNIPRRGAWTHQGLKYTTDLRPNNSVYVTRTRYCDTGGSACTVFQRARARRVAGDVDAHGEDGTGEDVRGEEDREKAQSTEAHSGAGLRDELHEGGSRVDEGHCTWTGKCPAPHREREDTSTQPQHWGCAKKGRRDDLPRREIVARAQPLLHRTVLMPHPRHASRARDVDGNARLVPLRRAVCTHRVPPSSVRAAGAVVSTIDRYRSEGGDVHFGVKTPESRHICVLPAPLSIDTWARIVSSHAHAACTQVISTRRTQRRRQRTGEREWRGDGEAGVVCLYEQRRYKRDDDLTSTRRRVQVVEEREERTDYLHSSVGAWIDTRWSRSSHELGVPAGSVRYRVFPRPATNHSFEGWSSDGMECGEGERTGVGSEQEAQEGAPLRANARRTHTALAYWRRDERENAASEMEEHTFQLRTITCAGVGLRMQMIEMRTRDEMGFSSAPAFGIVRRSSDSIVVKPCGTTGVREYTRVGTHELCPHAAPARVVWMRVWDGRGCEGVWGEVEEEQWAAAGCVASAREEVAGTSWRRGRNVSRWWRQRWRTRPTGSSKQQWMRLSNYFLKSLAPVPNGHFVAHPPRCTDCVTRAHLNLAFTLALALALAPSNPLYLRFALAVPGNTHHRSDFDAPYENAPRVLATSHPATSSRSSATPR
ncbi:hypothetical protein C8R46DRAFT_1313954 [Mycena filopes]|nr:hypothetical protein C8R46DRAFT_1313954 [Mycena filopes]